ncbi:MAG TPA: hypothetical protein VGJ94_18380 [Syntrophorhabdaceae bacterium]|jgi:hypothetical protein
MDKDLLHPSELLKQLFKEKPWQGADPKTAKYIFVGLDANFATDVETQIPDTTTYLEDGPKFWKSTGVHHPFMLDKYKGNGRSYHENFNLIGFKSAEADQV